MNEYELYLPTTDRDGKPYPEDLFAGYRKDLVGFFGGLTDTRHRNEGVWRVGRVEVRDEIRVWRVLSDRGDEGLRFMRDFRARLERELRQDEVLIVVRSIDTL